MKIDEEDYLAHYGTPRHSGRYPWGSGGNESGTPRSATFHDHVNELRKQGLKDVDIARGMGISTTQLRARMTISKDEQKQARIIQIEQLANKGMSNVAIGKQMGLNESSVRALREPGAKDRADVTTNTANALKELVANGNVDIGSGAENHLDISKEKLNAAVTVLKEQGYEVHSVPVRQLGTGKDTKVKVLAPPGTTWGDVMKNRDKIQPIRAFSDDGGRSYTTPKPPLSVHPSRVEVRYKEDGGNEADGVIYVRPGVPDISLGKARYAQVRIKVGDKHYLKGMAMYKDDLPKGTDLLFNANKSDTGNKLDAMKGLEPDPDLPFGAVVRQIVDRPGHPDAKPISAMNIVNEEGNWTKWSKSLSSQFLSKQKPTLAKTQLDLAYEQRKLEFDRINSLTNPTIKKKLLESFAEDSDSAAVHLHAARLPRQNWHAILPIESMPPGEVYAPNFRDGERVALIRYPHGGTFEIPELTVNNRHPEANNLLARNGEHPIDVIGIHHSVAERLSGADFDGDTVLVIPNNARKIQHTPALEGLKGFDPRSEYAPYHGMATIDGGVYNAHTKKTEFGPTGPNNRKQQLMGDVSNLITDMTIKGAPHEHIVRAVRHSMVIIDAEKHSLNYKESARRNNIAQLKADYQGSSRGGASTIISRARSPIHLPERKPRPAKDGGPINRDTGAKEFVPTNRQRLDRKTGKVVPRLERISKMADATDAHSLVSDVRTPTERLYADHANRLKDLANQARLAAINTPRLNYSASAKKAYAKEVESLNSKLALAKMNRPRERQAQLLANAAVRAKRQANPNLDKDSVRKIEYAELEKARARMGAGKKERRITIEPEEWNAIQAGAISNHRLKEILDNTDIDVVRGLATPKQQVLMTPNRTARAKAMLASGATRSDVADALGVSLSTLDRSTNPTTD